MGMILGSIVGIVNIFRAWSGTLSFWESFGFLLLMLFALAFIPWTVGTFSIAVLTFIPIALLIALIRGNFESALGAVAIGLACLFISYLAGKKLNNRYFWKTNRRSRLNKSNNQSVVFEKIIEIGTNGNSVLVQRFKNDSGETKWRWFLDNDLPDNFIIHEVVAQKITELEIENGWPLSFPEWHPETWEKRKSEYREKEAKRIEEQREQDLQIAKNPDFTNPAHRRSMLRLWSSQSRAISSDELIVGKIYFLGYSLARYLRSYQGLEKLDELDDEIPRSDTWYVFEISDGPFGNEADWVGESEWNERSVVKLDAPEELVERMFDLNQKEFNSK